MHISENTPNNKEARGTYVSLLHKYMTEQLE